MFMQNMYMYFHVTVLKNNSLVTLGYTTFYFPEWRAGEQKKEQDGQSWSVPFPQALKIKEMIDHTLV